MNGGLQQWLHILVHMLIILKTESVFVNITYVESAVAKAAVCLDGSPPAYHIDRGSGEGINNWIVHLEGGGWCNNVTTCLERKTTRLGSSNQMAKQVAFSGILSNERQLNPDFYNWNRVRIRYCDGASFTGDIEGVDPATGLYHRGARVFVAVIEDLLEKGMKNAKNAILSGCSAGGLATIIHCDSFKSLLPERANVKCVADAGFFINVKDISGVPLIEDFYKGVVATHGSAKNLPQSCTSIMKPSLCFFPQNIGIRIQTPLFILNAAYDSWQVRNILVPGLADPHRNWRDCRNNIAKCNTTQLNTLQGLRSEFIDALGRLGASETRGYFINSCYAHCQSELQETWFSKNSPALHDKKIAEAVGDWFFDRSSFQKIDCRYPCDKTCRNTIFDLERNLL